MEHQLLEAVEENNIAKVRQLLATYPTMNLNTLATSFMYEGETALMIAVAEKNIALTELLLKAGADVNFIATGEYNALRNALYHNCSPAMVQLLIDYGANVNYQPKKLEAEAHTLLGYPIAANNEALVALMIKNGADVNLPVPTKGGWRALDEALYRWHRPILIQLIEAGVDVNYIGEYVGSDTDFGNLLYEASKRGDLELMDMLIEHGADVSDFGFEDFGTPLSGAIFEKQYEAAKKLIKAGADIDRILFEGYNILMFAIDEEHPKEAVNLLIEGGADPNMMSDFGWTPLLLAAIKGEIEIARLLLAKGADINFISPKVEEHFDTYGQSALNLAAEHKQFEMMRFLIEQGADINSILDGEYLLHIIIREGNFRAVNILLEAGVDVTVIGKNKNSALHFLGKDIYYDYEMIKEGITEESSEHQKKMYHKIVNEKRIENKLEFIKELVIKGCPIHGENKYGRDSFDYMVGLENVEILAFLLKQGAKPCLIKAQDTEQIHFKFEDYTKDEILKSLFDKHIPIYLKQHKISPFYQTDKAIILNNLKEQFLLIHSKYDKRRACTVKPVEGTKTTINKIFADTYLTVFEQDSTSMSKSFFFDIEFVFVMQFLAADNQVYQFQAYEQIIKVATKDDALKYEQYYYSSLEHKKQSPVYQLFPFLANYIQLTISMLIRGVADNENIIINESEWCKVFDERLYHTILGQILNIIGMEKTGL